MRPFFISKRKFAELIFLGCLDIVLFLLWNSLDFIILFSLGFIWNWVASQDQQNVVPNTRGYRFSTLKAVFNLQNLLLKPLASRAWGIQFFARLLPAGLLWSGVIMFNQSEMPWWAIFLGSLVFELIVLEKKMFYPEEFPS
jgi:hypothetical protein